MYSMSCRSVTRDEPAGPPSQSQIRRYKIKALGRWSDDHPFNFETPQPAARSSALTPNFYSVLSPGTCAALEVRLVTAATRHRRTSPDYRKRFSIQSLFPDRTTSLPWNDTLRLLRSRRTEVPQLRRLELCQVTLPSKRPAHVWLIGEEKAKRASWRLTSGRCQSRPR